MDDWLRKVLENNVAICQTALELLQELKRQTPEEASNPKQRKLERKNEEYQSNLEEKNEEAQHNTPVQPCVREPTAEERFDTRRFYMSEETFSELCALLGQFHRPEGLSHEATVAITLEYLTSGDPENQLALAYKVTKYMLHRITRSVCPAICDQLAGDYMPTWTEERLLHVAEGFDAKWMFPHCVGAITLHALATTPQARVVCVIAVCDAYFRFTKLAVDSYGHKCRFNIFTNLEFGSQLLRGALPFPADAMLHNVSLPYFLVGGDSQPLCTRILRAFNNKLRPTLPEAQRLFNHRIEPARRCIDTAYGVLITRWRCIQQLESCSLRRAEYVVSACGLLHNFLLAKSSALYCPAEYAGYKNDGGVWVDGTWRQHVSAGLHCCEELPGFRSGLMGSAKSIRNVLKRYFNSPAGRLPLQKAVDYRLQTAE